MNREDIEKGLKKFGLIYEKGLDKDTLFVAILALHQKEILEARIDEQDNFAVYFSEKDFIRQYSSGCLDWIKIVNEKRSDRIKELQQILAKSKEVGNG